MLRALFICLGYLLATAPAVSHAKVYQCTIHGKVTYSDIPCSKDAKPIDMNVFMPSHEDVAKANERTQSIEQQLSSSQKERQIAVLQSEIEEKKRKMNDELASFDSQQGQVAPQRNRATEAARMQSMAKRYQEELATLNAELATLQGKIKP